MNNLKSFMEELFQKMNEYHIEYVVLRNYEHLPNSIGYDIDIFMQKKQIRIFERFLISTAEQFGWVIVNREQRQGFCSYIFFLKFNEAPLYERQLRFDILYSHVWKGLNWISSRKILDNKAKYKCFYIPDSGIEATILLLKDFLQCGYIKDKYRERLGMLIGEDSTKFVDTVSYKFGIKVAQSLHAKLVSKDWDGIISMRSNLQSILVLRNVFPNPFSAITGILGFLYGHINEFIKAPSLFVVLMGPDGVGKTSVISSLKNELHRTFQRYRFFKFRSGLLPELMAIRSRIFRKKGVAINKDSTLNSAYKPGSPIVSFARLIYYTLDFVMSYPLLRFLKGRRNLIIFDRYYYEYFVQQPSSGLPEWLIRFLMKIVPKPDAIIYLRGTHEVVLKRKQELTPEEFQKHSERYEILTSMLPNTYCVDADADLNSVVNNVGEIVLERMALRFRTDHLEDDK